MKPNEYGLSFEQRLQQNVEISTLCAFYGGLLTEKQRTALLLHYDEDLSLGEIAAQYGVSRQNIHDLISRSARKLQRMEEKIGFIAAARQNAARLQQALAALENARADAFPAADCVEQAEALIAQTIAQLSGEE